MGNPRNLITWTVIIVIIAVIYIYSAVKGVGTGIKRLSDINLILFVLLLAAAFLSDRDVPISEPSARVWLIVYGTFSRTVFGHLIMEAGNGLITGGYFTGPGGCPGRLL